MMALKKMMDRDGLKKIKLTMIEKNPAQPRKYFDKEALEQLAESIKQYGLLNPLTVRRTECGYELIAGERRLRAAKIAGLTEVPCIVLTADAMASSAIALVENLQRRDLDFFEEAEGYKRLIDIFGLTQEEAAKRVGKTQSAVANKLRLLKLSPDNRKLICDHGLTERHARCLLRIEDEHTRLQATAYMIQNELNVSRSEQYVEKLLQGGKPEEKSNLKVLRLIKDVRFFLNTIDKAVDVMKESGVAAEVEREEQEEGLILKIKIPAAKQ